MPCRVAFSVILFAHAVSAALYTNGLKVARTDPITNPFAPLAAGPSSVEPVPLAPFVASGLQQDSVSSGATAAAFFETDARYKMLLEEQALEQAKVAQKQVHMLAAAVQAVQKTQEAILARIESAKGGGAVPLASAASLSALQRSVSAPAQLPSASALFMDPKRTVPSTEVEVTEETLLNTFKIMLVVAIAWAVLTLITACIYKSCKRFPPLPLKPDEQQRIDLNHGWHYHILQCCHAPGMCCFTMLCPGIRWADTMRMANLIGFWWALLFFIWITDTAVIGTVFSSGLLLCVLVYYRQRIRQLFSMEYGTASTICVDCLAYIFCAVCALVQEAQQIELAWKTGHPMVDKDAAQPSSSARQPLQRAMP